MRLWHYLSTRMMKERVLRHKGDLPTTETDTNNRSADGDDYMSHNPTPPSDRAASTDPHLRAIEIQIDLSQASKT